MQRGAREFSGEGFICKLKSQGFPVAWLPFVCFSFPLRSLLFLTMAVKGKKKVGTQSTVRELLAVIKDLREQLARFTAAEQQKTEGPKISKVSAEGWTEVKRKDENSEQPKERGGGAKEKWIPRRN